MRDKIKKLIEEESAIDFSYGINSYTIYDHNIDKLVDSIVKLLDLHSVVGRSEQLKAFAEFCQDNYSFEIPDRIIKDYEKSL